MTQQSSPLEAHSEAQIIALEEWRTRRRHLRRRALWWGEITIGPQRHACSIFDLSLGGAKVKLNDRILPGPARAKLSLAIPPFGSFAGEMKWVAHPFLGVQFEVQDEDRIAELLWTAEASPGDGPGI